MGPGRKELWERKERDIGLLRTLDGKLVCNPEMRGLRIDTVGPVYDILVQNGIFNLNMPINRNSFLFDTATYLTPKGFKYIPFYHGGVTDGVAFEIEYKVGVVFRQYFIDVPDFYYELNPDDQELRRYVEII